jgi:predicted O-methyltransferase YrrM
MNRPAPRNGKQKSHNTEQVRSRVMELAHGYMDAQAIFTANEIGLFDQLAKGPATARVLARRLACDSRSIQGLLSALTCLDLIRLRGDTYALPLAAQSVLGRDGDQSIAVMLDHQQHLYHRFSHLADTVRSGKPSKTGKQPSTAQRHRFLRAMTQGSQSSLLQTVGLLNFKGVDSFLDLGGGGGAYAAAFAEAAPDVVGTVFDTPGTIAFTKRLLRKQGLHKRIHCISGDGRVDSLGGPYDLIFISNLIHLFSPTDIVTTLRNAKRSLAAGGRLVVKDFFLATNRRSPRFAGLFALNMLISSEGGNVYTEAEFKLMLSRAGLALRRRVPLGQASQIWITGVKRRE